MKPKLTERFFLSAGDCNAQGELSLAVLTSKIIDIATAHANSLGIGNPVMEHLDYGWILSRLAIEMQSYPKANSEYYLSTWIESFNRHFSVRNFEISDASGKSYGFATSVWMVLNWATRENAGTSHLNLAEEMISGDKAPISKFGKHMPIIEPGADDASAAHHALTATAPAEIRTFGYSDLDFYRHVNTVRYVAMLMNSFSLEEMDANAVRRIELAFMREGRYGETVRLLRSREDNQTWFALSDACDGTVLLSAAVVLRPRTFS